MTMRWEDEPFIKIYTRDSTDWLSMSWQAQGLFVLLLRKIDRAGVLELGKHGLKGVSAHIGGPAAWPELEGPLQQLVDDGCIEVHGDRLLVVPNFVYAQAAQASSTARSKAYRERARDLASAQAAGINTGDAAGRGGTLDGTPVGDALGRAGTNRREETRIDEKTSGVPPADGPQPAPVVGQFPPPNEAGDSGAADSAAPVARKRRSRTVPGYTEFVAHFDTLFQAHRKAKPVWGQKQGKLVKDLLKRGGLDDAIARASRMFAMAPRWPAENPDLQTLVGHWDKFAPPVAGGGGHATASDDPTDFVPGEEGKF